MKIHLQILYLLRKVLLVMKKEDILDNIYFLCGIVLILIFYFGEREHSFLLSFWLMVFYIPFKIVFKMRENKN